MKELFRNISEKVTSIVGSVWALLTAILIVLVWLISGPLFNFSDTWLLIINTITTIVTFLMVFVIQNSQNREAKATQIKLNELIIAVDKAHNEIAGVEKKPDEALQDIEKEVLNKEMYEGI